MTTCRASNWAAITGTPEEDKQNDSDPHPACCMEQLASWLLTQQIVLPFRPLIKTDRDTAQRLQLHRRASLQPSTWWYAGLSQTLCLIENKSLSQWPVCRAQRRTAPHSRSAEVAMDAGE